MRMVLCIVADLLIIDKVNQKGLQMGYKAPFKLYIQRLEETMPIGNKYADVFAEWPGIFERLGKQHAPRLHEIAQISWNISEMCGMRLLIVKCMYEVPPALPYHTFLKECEPLTVAFSGTRIPVSVTSDRQVVLDVDEVYLRFWLEQDVRLRDLSAELASEWERVHEVFYKIATRRGYITTPLGLPQNMASFGVAKRRQLLSEERREILELLEQAADLKKAVCYFLGLPEITPVQCGFAETYNALLADPLD